MKKHDLKVTLTQIEESADQVEALWVRKNFEVNSESVFPYTRIWRSTLWIR